MWTRYQASPEHCCTTKDTCRAASLPFTVDLAGRHPHSGTLTTSPSWLAIPTQELATAGVHTSTGNDQWMRSGVPPPVSHPAGLATLQVSPTSNQCAYPPSHD